MITPAVGTTFHGTVERADDGMPLRPGARSPSVNTYSYMGEVPRADLSAVTDFGRRLVLVPVTTAERAHEDGPAARSTAATPSISPSGSGGLACCSCSRCPS